MVSIGLVHSNKTQKKIDEYKSVVLNADSVRYATTDRIYKDKSLCVQRNAWEKEYNSVMDSINAYENIKGIFQIKQCTIINISNRKKNLIENDPLLKIYNDIHLFFIEKIKNICKKVNKSENDFLKESNLIYNKDARKIFGLIQNE